MKHLLKNKSKSLLIRHIVELESEVLTLRKILSDKIKEEKKREQDNV